MKRRSESAAGHRPGPPDDETERSDEPWRDDEHPPFVESLTDWDADIVEADDDQFEAEEETPIPFCRRQSTSSSISLRCFQTTARDRAPSLSLLYQGAAEVLGGLAQSLSDREPRSRVLRAARRAAQACPSRCRVCPRRPPPASIDHQLGTV